MSECAANHKAQTDCDAIVVGGGVAGIAAAVKLASLGIPPILVEKRPFLGGRAFSFSAPPDGRHVDNGQHVILGACTEYIKLLKIIGVSDKIRIQQRLNVPIIRNGRTAKLRNPGLPGKLGNLAALMLYRHLSFLDRVRVLLAIGIMRFVNLEKIHDDGKTTFLEWLKSNFQNQETLERFWEPITLAALNDFSASVSFTTGIMLFQTAFIHNTHNAAMGYSSVGLSELIEQAAQTYLEKRGGRVIKGVAVSRLEFETGRPSACFADGKKISAECLISALPASELLKIIPKPVAESPFFSRAGRMRYAPIAAVHIWYDREVMDDHFTAILDSPIQWIFNVSAIHGDEPPGHILISLSGAWEWQHVPKDEMRTRFASEMKSLFPKARTATVKRVTIVKTPEATFRPEPGSDYARLPQNTPLPFFFLAGDWVDTGWPSTMESAARSGFTAAEAVASSGLVKPRKA